MPAPRGLVQWLDQYLHREEVLPREGRLLVAVSGGADSVALLRLLHEINQGEYWGWELVVGHVDHGMRGAASREDARWVEKLAEAQGVEFEHKTLNMNPGASEGEARRRRLGVLETMSVNRGCAGVVMAHHAEDQAETVLMRMFRGCGLEGIQGMRPVTEMGRLRILRPVLGVGREELRAYLKTIGQEWREDATNAEAVYTRNRVRHELMPVVESIWPRAVEALGRLARVAGTAHELIVNVADSYQQESIFELEGAKKWVKYSWQMLRAEHPAVVAELLREAVEAVGGTREIADWERIMEAVRMISGEEGGRQVEMGRGVVVRVSEGTVAVALERTRHDAKEEGDLER